MPVIYWGTARKLSKRLPAEQAAQSIGISPDRYRAVVVRRSERLTEEEIRKVLAVTGIAEREPATFHQQIISSRGGPLHFLWNITKMGLSTYMGSSLRLISTGAPPAYFDFCNRMSNRRPYAG